MDVFGLETSLCQSVGARAHSVVRLGTTRYQSISLRLQTHSISIANWPPKITLGGFRKDVFLSERVRVFDGQLFAYPSKNRVIFISSPGFFNLVSDAIIYPVNLFLNLWTMCCMSDVPFVIFHRLVSMSEGFRVMMSSEYMTLFGSSHRVH